MSKLSSNSATKPAILAAPGVISPLDIYRLDEALARLGWTTSAYRAARRRGLQVLACGKRRFLRGEEIIRFLTADSGSEKSETA